MSGTKRSSTVPVRLREFFERNPHEELTVDDIRLKFGCSYDTAMDALRSMGDDVMRVIVYRLKTPEEGA